MSVGRDPQTPPPPAPLAPPTVPVSAVPDMGAIADAHAPAVWRYLRYLGCDASEADDLTQETFVQAIERPFEYRGEAATSGYLRTVARHLLISVRRREKRAVSLEEMAGADRAWEQTLADASQAFAAGIRATRNRNDDEHDDAYRLRLATLQRCLERVDGNARAIVDLFYRDGLSGDAIAARLDLSAEYVRVALYRTRKTLQQCIERKLRSTD